MPNFPRPDGRPETLDEMRRLLKEDEERRRELTGDVAAPFAPDPMAGADSALHARLRNLNTPTPTADDPALAARGGDFAGKKGDTLTYTPVELTGAVDAPSPSRLADTKDEDATPPVAEAAPTPPPLVEAPTAPTPESPDELADAQDSANRARLMHGLLTAGSMFNKGFSGVDDVGRFQKAEADSEIPVQQALARIRQKRATEADRLALEKLAYERARNTQNDETRRQAAEAAAAKAAVDAEATRAFREKQLQNSADQLKLSREKFEFEKTKPKSSYVADMDRAIRERKADTDLLPKYEDKIKPYGKAAAVLEEIDNIAPGFSHGIVDPNVSVGEGYRLIRKLPGGVGSQFTQAQQEALNSAFGLLKQYIIRPEAGANLTEIEAQQFRDMMNDSVFSKPEAQAAFIDLYRKTVARNLRRTRAAYRRGISEEAWREYENNGGLTENAKIFQDPETESGPRVVSSNEPVPPQEDRNAQANTAADTIGVPPEARDDFVNNFETPDERAAEVKRLNGEARRTTAQKILPGVVGDAVGDIAAKIDPIRIAAAKQAAASGRAPKGTVPMVDPRTGEIGFVPETEVAAAVQEDGLVPLLGS